MGIGDRIRKIRKSRGMTQAQVAEKVGLTGAAVRHYENGIRKAGPEQTAAVAGVLGVRPEAITDYHIASDRDIIEALFRIEELTGMKPVETPDGVVLAPGKKPKESHDITYALIDWSSMHEKLDAGEISQDEYDEWKLTYEG